ncbi:hypothetical protein BDV39DRAFT_210018 [Aspergillus sergii]|uniref:Protein kinase domain-containing protein n=1 Tax=Aspergillus sergii TaxID=1034303 RepID=A0A5N6WMY4_9EURO|nr:hypothetical protein BDV39DRAFT_210018 [Aspergillus sergii]
MADPLGIAASVVTLIQLAGTATEYLRGIKHGADDRVKLRDELRSTVYLLEVLRDRIEDAEDAMVALGTHKPLSIQSFVGPDNPLILFRRLLEDIIAQLSPQSKLHHRSLSLVWPFTKKDVAEKLACLERLKSHFTLVMQSDLLQLTQLSHRMVQSSHEKIVDIEQKVDETHSRQQEEQKQKIFSWLGALQFREQHVAILESVQSGTGGWFINHEVIKAWLEGETSMVWCPGLPGAGKTRLMSIVIDALEKEPKARNTLHTYIYCNYARRAEQSSTAMLSSLLLQVLQYSEREAIPPEVLSLYKTHRKYGTRLTLKELIGLLAKLTQQLKTLFVVIDALDECAVSDDEALKIVSTIRSIGSNTVVMCSSRFSTTFESHFTSEERVEILAQDEDITTFLDAQIDQQPRLSKHVRADPALRQEIIDFITGECQGMFLLAKLHLESLATKINRKAVRSALRTLPTTLDDTYSEALQRIYDQPMDNAELAELVLLWLVCAHQNLTVMQLQHMYATLELPGEEALEDDNLPDGDILTAACGGLITVDTESQLIHVIHYTVQQYLERTLGQKLVIARMNLTKVCLTYLTLPNFSSGICASDAAMLQRLVEFPFLEYAAKHWGSDISVLQQDEILPHVNQLLSNPIAVEVANQAWSLSEARHPNWSQEFPRNIPAIVLAAAFDVSSILQHMVADGHDIEDCGTDKETALIRAAAFGHAENVRALLGLGAAVDTKDYMNETALQKAARNGHVGVIRVLVNGGAGVNSKGSSNWTSLMSAVSSGSIDAVRLLIEAGADLTTETVWGDSALSIAVRSGQEAIAALLADCGAVMPHGLEGHRAFHLASRRGLQNLVRRLTIDYEAVAGKTLTRQSNRVMTGLFEALEETQHGKRPDSQIEAEPCEVISFGEFMEYYDIKTSFHERYTVQGQLGKGHFATVYRCSDKVTGLIFAVKIVELPEPVSSSWVESYGEIDLLHSLRKYRHQNILNITDVFVDFGSNSFRLVTTFAAEGDLFNVIVSKGKLTQPETRTIFNQLLLAIQFLHEHGWVHRDIKPENILVMDKALTIQLGDFGISKQIQADAKADALPTTLCGTPSYVAPEILVESRKRKYGFGVDIWSSGVVMYICLCGFPPFSDDLYTKESPYTLAQQIKLGRYDYPSPYWDPVADSALDLIDRMLTVDPDQRLSAPDCLSHAWMRDEPWADPNGISRMQNAVSGMNICHSTTLGEAKAPEATLDSKA